MNIDISQHRACIGSYQAIYLYLTARQRKNTNDISQSNNCKRNSTFKRGFSYKFYLKLFIALFISSSLLSNFSSISRSEQVKVSSQSKITLVVCPRTTHTNPLMTIGSHPTNTMVPRLQVLGLVEGVPGVKMGVERQQQFNRSYKYIVLTLILKIHPNDY